MCIEEPIEFGDREKSMFSIEPLKSGLFEENVQQQQQLLWMKNSTK